MEFFLPILQLKLMFVFDIYWCLFMTRCVRTWIVPYNFLILKQAIHDVLYVFL